MSSQFQVRGGSLRFRQCHYCRLAKLVGEMLERSVTGGEAYQESICLSKALGNLKSDINEGKRFFYER